MQVRADGVRGTGSETATGRYVSTETTRRLICRFCRVVDPRVIEMPALADKGSEAE